MAMSKLSYDKARCTGEHCPARYNCARFTAPGRPEGQQVYVEPAVPGPDGCQLMIDNAMNGGAPAEDAGTGTKWGWL